MSMLTGLFPHKKNSDSTPVIREDDLKEKIKREKLLREQKKAKTDGAMELSSKEVQLSPILELQTTTETVHKVQDNVSLESEHDSETTAHQLQETIESTQETSDSVEESDGVVPQSFETVTFYRQPIRKTFFDGQWVAVLEDIVAITGTVDLKKYLNKLRLSAQYQENSAEHICMVPVIVGDKTEIIECIGLRGFTWLLPILRADERFFPGPFPGWIQSVLQPN